MCRRIVKLLQTGLTDEVKRYAADTIAKLAKDNEIAIELGQIHGLDELATLAQSDDPTFAYSAAMALTSLSAVTENLDVLTEIGTIEAAVAAFETEDTETQSALLDVVKNLSSNADAAKQMIHAGVVPMCISVLQGGDNEPKQQAMVTLANMLKVETAGETPGEDDSDADEDVEGEYDEYEEAEEDEEAADDENGASSLVGQIVEAGGVDSLVDMLEDSDLDDHASIIVLLTALATADEPSKRKIGGCLASLMAFLRDGSAVEQGAAAAAIVTLVDGSKRNTATAIRARVVDSFIAFVGSQVDIETVKLTVSGLVSAFKSIKSPEASSANKKILEALVNVALSDATQRGSNASAVLNEMASSASFVKLIVDTNAVAMSVDLLKQAASGNQEESPSVGHASSLLLAIAYSTYYTKLAENGHLAQLTPLLGSVPLATRCHLASTTASCIRSDLSLLDATGATGTITCVLEMVFKGTYDERAAGVELLTAINDASPTTLAKLTVRDELLDASLMWLAPADDELLRQWTLWLLTSLSRHDEAMRESISQRKPLLQRVNELLFEEEFQATLAVIEAVDSLLANADARAFFVDAGVEKRLEYLGQWYAPLTESTNVVLASLRAAAA